MRPAPAPDDPRLADDAAGWVGAYIHIPFCRRVCPYCDFAVVQGGEDLREPYLSALVAEIESGEPFDRPLDAVFVGGGTPTSIDPADLRRVVTALRDRFRLAADAEVSVEANPEDVTAEAAAGLAAAGFNRMSLGVQSFDPDVLDVLGRRHGPDQAMAAIGVALAAFPSVNVDLIFGTPGESLPSWKATVATAVDAGIHHLSAYALTVERGTPLGRAVQAGAPAPDPDDQADKYEHVVRVSERAGLVRYETSNFARPGHHCRYNLLTWAQGEYAGFGNGAHRHRDGVRSWNVRRVDRYVERAGTDPRSGEELIAGWAREVERVTLGLRRASGVVAGRGGETLLSSPEGERLLRSGVIAVHGDRLVVARPLLGDEAARALIGAPPPG